MPEEIILFGHPPTTGPRIFLGDVGDDAGLVGSAGVLRANEKAAAPGCLR
jgi:hypothetical protein